MASIRRLLNIDRPYTAKEINKTHHALAQAMLLERQKPNAAEPHILRVQIYFALKDYVRSRASLTKALDLDPDNFYATVRLSITLHHLGKKADASAGLERALRPKPRSIWSRSWQWAFAGDKGPS